MQDHLCTKGPHLLSAMADKRSFSLRNADVFPHGLNRTLFQPGDLCLGDAQMGSDFHLGFSVIKTKGQNFLFTGLERPEGKP